MELVGFEDPVGTVAVVVKVEPVFWAICDLNFLSDVASKNEAQPDWMFESFLQSGHRPLEIAGRKILFIWSDAHFLIVENDGGPGR